MADCDLPAAVDPPAMDEPVNLAACAADDALVETVLAGKVRLVALSQFPRMSVTEQIATLFAGWRADVDMGPPALLRGGREPGLVRPPAPMNPA